MAHRWEPPFDPKELKDFTRDWSEEMAATSDTLATATWELPDDATAATLTVATSYLSNGVMAVMWLHATDPIAFAEAFEGKDIEVSHSITTTAGRTLHETCVVR